MIEAVFVILAGLNQDQNVFQIVNPTPHLITMETVSVTKDIIWKMVNA